MRSSGLSLAAALAFPMPGGRHQWQNRGQGVWGSSSWWNQPAADPRAGEAAASEAPVRPTRGSGEHVTFELEDPAVAEAAEIESESEETVIEEPEPAADARVSRHIEEPDVERGRASRRREEPDAERGRARRHDPDVEARASGSRRRERSRTVAPARTPAEAGVRRRARSLTPLRSDDVPRTPPRSPAAEHRLIPAKARPAMPKQQPHHVHVEDAQHPPNHVCSNRFKMCNAIGRIRTNLVQHEH